MLNFHIIKRWLKIRNHFNVIPNFKCSILLIGMYVANPYKIDIPYKTVGISFHFPQSKDC